MEQGTVKWIRTETTSTSTAEVDLSRGIYAGIDWDYSYKRLCVFARLASKRMPDVFDGVSVEDLVNDVFLMLFGSHNRLGWNAEKGALDRFLMGVLKHKMIDRLRRESKNAGSFDDPIFARSAPVFHVIAPDPDNRILKAVHGDQQLRELVLAADRIGSGKNVNQRLAKELKTTSEDIANRKKRLKRKLQKQLLIGGV